MPSRLVNRLDLEKLYLPFLTRVLDTLAECEERGAVYVATEGFRSNTQQAKLYFQGRTLPGHIVTDARPGYSCHNYGIAVDVCRDWSPKAGLQPDWNPAHYDVLADVARHHQLQCNIPKGSDYGHLQLPLRAKLNRDEKGVLRLLKNAESMEAAWELLTGMGPW